MKRRDALAKKILAGILSAAILLQSGSFTALAEKGNSNVSQATTIEQKTEKEEFETEESELKESETVEITSVVEHDDSEEVTKQATTEEVAENIDENVIIKEATINMYEGYKFLGLEGTVKKARIPVDFYVRMYDGYIYSDDDKPNVVTEKWYYSADSDTEIVDLPTTFWAEYPTYEFSCFDVIAKYSVDEKEYEETIYRDSYIYGGSSSVGNLVFYNIDNAVVNNNKLQVSLGVNTSAYSFEYYIKKPAKLDTSTSMLNIKTHMSCSEADINDLIISDITIDSWNFDEDIVYETDSIPEECNHKSVGIWCEYTFYEYFPFDDAYWQIDNNEESFDKFWLNYDVHNSLGSFKELFPDDNLRHYLMDYLDKTDENDAFTDEEAKNLMYTYSIGIPYSDTSIKSLEGVDNIEGLVQLCFEYHEIETLDNIDWSKLTNLESIFLAGNNIKEIPDLRACKSLKYVGLDNNLISQEEIDTISYKLPEGCEWFAGNQRDEVKSVITEDAYYNFGGAVPFAVELSGYKLTSNVKIEWKIDGEVVELNSVDYMNNAFYGELSDLSEGVHTLSGTVKSENGDFIDVINSEINIICDSVVLQAPNRVVGSDEFLLNVYGKDNYLPTNVKLLDKDGRTIVDGYSIYRDEDVYGLFEKLPYAGGYFYNKGYARQYYYIIANNVFFNRANRLYDVKVEFADGTSKIYKEYFGVVDKPYIQSVDLRRDINDEYFDAFIYGMDLDFSKLSFNFMMNNQTELVTECVEYKSYGYYNFVRFKKINWHGYDKNDYIGLTVTPIDGYDIIIENNDNYYNIRNEEYLCYNEAKSLFEMTVSDSNVGKILDAKLIDYTTDGVVRDVNFVAEPNERGITTFDIDMTGLSGGYRVEVSDGDSYIASGYVNVNLDENSDESAAGEDELFDVQFKGLTSDVFMMDGFLQATVDDEQNLIINIGVNDVNENDEYRVRLFDDYSSEFTGLSTEVLSCNDNMVSLLVKGIKPEEILRNYYVIITRNGLEAVDSLGNNFFAEEGNYLYISSKYENYTYTEKDSSELWRTTGIYTSNLSFPVKLTVYNSLGTEKYLEKEIYESDVKNECYFFLQEDIDRLPDEDGMYDIIWVDAKNHKNVVLETYIKLSKYVINAPVYVLYELNGGTNNESNPDVIRPTDEYVYLMEPTRPGYIFDGWYFDSEFVQPAYEIYADDSKTITVYAKWIVEEFSIYYELNCINAKNDNPDSYTVESGNIKLNAPTRTGYTFNGWYLDSKFRKKVTEIDTAQAKDISVYAKWTANTYRVHFDGNGGNVVIFDRFYTYDKSYNIPYGVKIRWGYKFAGWNTKKDGTGTSFKDMGSVKNLTSKNNEIVTLYAQWKK